MKTHKTVKITERMLRRLHACDDGIKLCKRLGGTISTDPLKNMSKALQIAEYHRETYWCIGHVAWLAARLKLGLAARMGGTIRLPDDSEPIYPSWDAYQVAQMLAWIADRILTKQGR